MTIQPRLKTIEKTRDFIRSNNGEYSTYQIWSKLKKKQMYQSHQATIKYLLHNNEITIKEDKKISYIEQKTDKLNDTSRNTILYNLSLYGYNLISLRKIKNAKALLIEDLIIQILLRFPEARFIEAIPTLMIKNKIDKFELYRKAHDYALINKIGFLLETSFILTKKTKRDIHYLRELLTSFKLNKDNRIIYFSMFKDKEFLEKATPKLMKDWNLRGRFLTEDFYKQEYL